MGCLGSCKSKLKKLKLLLWKNSLIERRRPLVILLEFILPVIIPSILVIVRSSISVTDYPDSTEYEEFPLSLAAFVPWFIGSVSSPFPPTDGNGSNFNCDAFLAQFNLSSAKIAYVPGNDDLATTYAKGVVESLPCILDGIIPYDDETTMENDLSFNDTSMDGILCAIVFDKLQNSSTSYKIRFPFSLRLNSGLEDWETNILYPQQTPNGPRNPFGAGATKNISNYSESANNSPFKFLTSEDFRDSEMYLDRSVRDLSQGFSVPEVINLNSFGGWPSYFLEGFLPVQAALDLSIMTHWGVKDAEKIEIFSRRFPFPPYISDNFVTILESFLPQLFLLCFVFMTFNIVKSLVVEKEKRLKESMKIMGLENYLHWTAWCVHFSLFTLAVVCLTVIFLCAKMSEYKVLPYSDWSVVFVFVLLYGLSSMMFCFFLSTCFSKANSAAVVATLLWFLSFLPWLLISTSYESLSVGSKIVSCLLCNTAMGIGSFIIGQFEASGVGAQWSVLHQPVNSDDNISLLSILLMLMFDIVLYGLLAWYVEAVFPGEFGYPQKFYFPFQKSYWFGSADEQNKETTEAERDCSEAYIEDEPKGTEKGIEIVGLRKVFGEKVAVNNLHLNLYDDQITVLLGHNGAGKSTTMSMLTGLFPPTSGNATVNGFTLKGQLGRVRESLGLCPQHDVLFDNLTVEEHLEFFGALKGATPSELKFQIPDLLEQLQLDNKRTAKSKTLSGGMKRKLSVAIALIGNSKIVVLDEPTSGMDPAARRLTWDVLLNNKADRTIMLTTHFMDEADVLGDRIAIMAEGRLQCVGSSMFLKRKYGVGYQLSIVKSEGCDVEKIKKQVQIHVPSASVERNIGSELMINLPSKAVDKFHPLFELMENERESLGLESYGVSVTTIEEVFLRVGKLYDDETTPDADGRHYSISGGPHESNDDSFSLDTTTVNFQYNDSAVKQTSSLKLICQQFQATFVKRVIHSWRNKKLAIAQILIPAFCVSVALLTAKIAPDNLDLPSLVMNLKDYKKTITVYSSDQNSSVLMRAYESIVTNSAFEGSTTIKAESDVSVEIINQAIADLGTYNTKMMVAAEFREKSITMLFNNQAYHTAPLSLNLINNAIFAANEIVHTITVANDPLPPTIEDSQNAVETGAAIWKGFNIAFNVAFGFAFLVASFVLFPVKERSTKSKHLQYVSGLQPSIFWLSAFVWDLLNFLASCIILIILFAMFQVDAYTQERLFYVFLIFCEYSLAALPMMYCLSFMFHDSTSAFVRCTTVNIILAVGTMLTVVILQALGKFGPSESLGWTFLVLIPQYSLPIALVDLYTNYEANQLCSQKGLTYADCKEDFGDQISNNYFSWERPGVARYCVFYLLQSVAFWIILICIESNLTQVIKGKIAKSKVMNRNEYSRLQDNEERLRMGSLQNGNPKSSPQDNVKDVDVTKQENYVKGNLIEAIDSSTLTVDGLSKTYYSGDCCSGDVSIVNAVKKMYLTVSPAECFGLLGINGAGKTTTFQMLTGDIPMSGGTAYIKGLDISKNIKKAQQMMGYCPQFDALIDQMTGRETLRMFARLRGLKAECIEQCIDELITLLDLTPHANKMTRAYSGGNKRKLSTAIAMIGLPPLVFLDEPTTGMDPGARRSLWKVILHLVRSNSLSIILTSHSMEECEYLCSRLAIMVNGEYQCLGSPQHLKSRFGQGFTLVAKLEYDPTGQYKQRYHEFIASTFPKSVLKDEHQTMIQYQVVQQAGAGKEEGSRLRWSEVFQTMQQHRDLLHIQDYSVSQTSLEQVFLNFARNQAQ